MVRFRSNGTKSSSLCSIKQLIIYFLLSTFSYYLGNISSTAPIHEKSQLEDQIIQLKLNYKKEQEEVQQLNEQLKVQNGLDSIKQKLAKAIQERNEFELEYNSLKLNMQNIINANVEEKTKDEKSDDSVDSVDSVDSSSNSNSSASVSKKRFAQTSSFEGMAYVSKKEFMDTYDFGSPIESPLSKDVLLLYTSRGIPTDISEEQKLGITTSSADPPRFDSPAEATNNCHVMHVATIPTPDTDKNTCFAIVQNYHNQFTQKWMRKNHNPKNELEYVNRGHTEKLRVHRPPDTNHVTKHWETLRTYLNNIDDVLKELKPIAESVAKDNTIIVLTCNMGQSELLLNFVCNAKAKGLDVGNILVFPTDEETKELAEGLGLTTFHDERNFGKLPKGAAKGYGDRNFSAMMIAKVVCVQLINHLGYDLLFQDVDVVWYKNPLEYFHDTTNPYYGFDMYFQDDGAHSPRYAPYSANSGFYYVRNNDKTKYLFTSLLYHGDMIVQSTSHQQALIQLLGNHASLFGLRVKVLSRDMEEFPGGWHYHRRMDLMKDIVTEKVVPEIFHMSWTKNKDNKVKFFQQMGQWYVNDSCIGSTKASILKSDEEDGEVISSQDVLFEPCCLPEPNIVCHYRDKPSKIPCRDKEPIDKGRPSFW